jgi:hypothetical protein
MLFWISNLTMNKNVIYWNAILNIYQKLIVMASWKWFSSTVQTHIVVDLTNWISIHFLPTHYMYNDDLNKTHVYTHSFIHISCELCQHSFQYKIHCIRSVYNTFHDDLISFNARCWVSFSLQICGILIIPESNALLSILEIKWDAI